MGGGKPPCRQPALLNPGCYQESRRRRFSTPPSSPPVASEPSGNRSAVNRLSPSLYSPPGNGMGGRCRSVLSSAGLAAIATETAEQRHEEPDWNPKPSGEQSQQAAPHLGSPMPYVKGLHLALLAEFLLLIDCHRKRSSLWGVVGLRGYSPYLSGKIPQPLQRSAAGSEGGVFSTFYPRNFRHPAEDHARPPRACAARMPRRFLSRRG